MARYETVRCAPGVYGVKDTQDRRACCVISEDVARELTNRLNCGGLTSTDWCTPKKGLDGKPITTKTACFPACPLLNKKDH